MALTLSSRTMLPVTTRRWNTVAMAEINLVGLGSMTHENEEEKAGFEPDTCYCIGTEKEVADFAIEVYSAVSVAYLVIWMLCALLVGRFSLRMGGQFVAAIAAMTALVTIANSAMAWSGAPVPARVACVVLLALMLSGAGLRVAAGRMRAMEQLAR